MTQIEALRAVLEKVEAATGPDREIDALALRAVAFPEGKVEQSPINGAWCIFDPRIVRNGRPRLWEDSDWWRPDGWPVTSSIEACIALAGRVLPGWWYRIGTCWVSDDATIAPDFNDPVHGDRLRAEIGPFESGSIWDAGVDIDRRPPGNLPLAMLECILTAKIALLERAGETT